MHVIIKLKGNSVRGSLSEGIVIAQKLNHFLLYIPHSIIYD